MIRIRDISLAPGHSSAELVSAAARQLRIRDTEIKRLDIRKRSVDARKKNDVRLIYTVDVLVKGREDKILKWRTAPRPRRRRTCFMRRRSLHSSRRRVRWSWASGPQACLPRWCWRWRGFTPLCSNAVWTRSGGRKRWRRSGRAARSTRSATSSSERAAPVRFLTESSTPARKRAHRLGAGAVLRGRRRRGDPV